MATNTGNGAIDNGGVISTDDHMEDTRTLIEQFRANIENQQVERTRYKERNVIITIDRKSRETDSPPILEEQDEVPVLFDASALVPRCCGPIPLLLRTMSTETPSTKSVTIDVLDSQSFLQSASSEMIRNISIFSQQSGQEHTDVLSADSSFDEEQHEDDFTVKEGTAEEYTDTDFFSDDGSTSHFTRPNAPTETVTVDEEASAAERAQNISGFFGSSLVDSLTETDYDGEGEEDDSLLTDEDTLATEIIHVTSNRRESEVMVKDDDSVHESFSEESYEDDTSVEKESMITDGETHSEFFLEENGDLEASVDKDESSAVEIYALRENGRGKKRRGQKLFIVRSEHDEVSTLLGPFTSEDEEESTLYGEIQPPFALNGGKEDVNEEEHGIEDNDIKYACESLMKNDRVARAPVQTYCGKEKQKHFRVKSEYGEVTTALDRFGPGEESTIHNEPREEEPQDESTCKMASATNSRYGEVEQSQEDDQCQTPPDNFIEESGNIPKEAAISQAQIASSNGSNCDGEEIQRAIETIGRAIEDTILEKKPFEVSSLRMGPISFLSGTGSVHSVPKTLLSSDADEEKGISAPVEAIYRLPFIHGSFSATAPSLVYDLKWMRILRKLMPHSHASAVVEMQKTGSDEKMRVVKLMKWAGNNPVVAAYGTFLNSSLPESEMSMPTPTHSNRVVQKNSVNVTGDELHCPDRVVECAAPPLEWNVFLDPFIVEQIDSLIGQARTLRLQEDIDETNHEIIIQLSRLVQRMVISHGSVSQILSDVIGVSPAFLFSSITNALQETSNAGLEQVPEDQVYGEISSMQSVKWKESDSTILATKWLAIFATALYLGSQGQNKSLPTSIQEFERKIQPVGSSGAISNTNQILSGLLLCFGFPDSNSISVTACANPFGKSTRYIEQMLGAPLRVVLNLGSQHVPSRVWGKLVDYLRGNGVHVDAIGSFRGDVIRAIGDTVSAPVKQYHYFHSAGDVQKACHAGQIKQGDSVFFNAASLIATDQSLISVLVCGIDEFNDVVEFAEYAYPRSSLSPYPRNCNAILEDYKRKFNLKIGCYVHEFAVSSSMVDSMINFINIHSSVYDLGFAYGNINGLASTGPKGDGFAGQRFMGRQWDAKANPHVNIG